MPSPKPNASVDAVLFINMFFRPLLVMVEPTDSCVSSELLRTDLGLVEFQESMPLFTDQSKDQAMLLGPRRTDTAIQVLDA